MSKLFRYLVAGIALATLPQPAHADTVQIFTVSNAVFLSGSTLSGEVGIDVTDGEFVSANLMLFDPEPEAFLTVISESSSGSGPYSGAFIQEAGLEDTPQGLVLLVLGDTLVGYAGGTLCTFDTPCVPPSSDPTGYTQYGGDAFGDPLVSGSLVADTPEPGSIILLGTGIACALGFLRRRLLTQLRTRESICT
jgi:hypothetical protein